MTISLDRRGLLSTSLGLATFMGLAGRLDAAGTDHLRLGTAEPFSFDRLVERAQAMSKAEYVPPPRPAPQITDQIDYDAHGKLRTRPEAAVWTDAGSVYPITYVHMGRFFSKTVRLNVVENGQAREIIYSPDLFTTPADHVARQLPADASAFAGFWIQESRRSGDWSKREPWVTFAGASYFRAVGALGQVGLSARGIALNVADTEPEEFPDFTHFWFEPAAVESDPVMVYALLDGPSISGAYRFEMHRDRAVLMDIECRLFLRKDIHRLGIAPLTSMFWYGEAGSVHQSDWRPEVHDSDGLAIWNGSDERIWRPLNNPAHISTSIFSDRNPRGFGLSQRDRNYDHYLDGVAYDRRPTAWIEPLHDWGEGSVQLVEIPTDDEIYDNIALYWLSAEPARAGDAKTYRYRLHWDEFEPYFPILDKARCVATRIGRGGVPGQNRPRDVIKFIIEFDGANLSKIPWGVRPEVAVTTSRGELSLIRAEPLWYTPRWLAQFDLKAEGNDPVELRCFLTLEGKPITETWLYQWLPRPMHW